MGAFFLSLIGGNRLCALNGIAVRCAFCLMDRFTQRSAHLALDRLNIKRRLLGSIICGTQVQPVANDNAPCMFAKSKRLVQFSGNSYLTFAGNFNNLGFCVHNSLLSHQAPPEKCPAIMRIIRLVFASVSLCRAHCVKNNRKARKRKTRLQPSRRVLSQAISEHARTGRQNERQARRCANSTQRTVLWPHPVVRHLGPSRPQHPLTARF